MAYKNWEREYHRNRLAKNYLHYTHFGAFSFKYGLHRDYSDYVNDGGWYSVYSKDEGSRRRRYKYELVQSNVNNKHLVPSTLHFDDIDFWEAQELEYADRIMSGKKWSDKGSLIGYGRSKKYLRTKYNRIRRRNGKKYCYHAVVDNLDWADDRIAHEKRDSYWWDIF